MVRMRDRKILNFQSQVFDFTGDLKHACLSLAATEATLNNSKELCGQMFDEKKALILEGVRKCKMIKHLQSEMKSAVDFYKGSKKYEESHALDFIKGIWHGDKQVNNSIQNILLNLETFPFLMIFRMWSLTSQ